MEAEHPVVGVVVDLRRKRGPSQENRQRQRRGQDRDIAERASYLETAFSISSGSLGSAALNTFAPFAVTSTTSSMRTPRCSSPM
jgi:hypothetical protein